MVKGVAEPLAPFRVVGERLSRSIAHGPRRWWSARRSSRGSARRAQVAAGVDRPIAALVRGDAGVGKTRLVAAIADEVRAAGGCVVVLHGSPSTPAPAFTRCGP